MSSDQGPVAILSEELQVSSAAITWIALAFREKLCAEGVPSEHEATNGDLTKEQTDILEYIAGAIIHKLLKRFDQNDPEQRLLDSLFTKPPLDRNCHKDHTYAKLSMIELKTHGGLKTPTELFWKFLCLLELFFRETVGMQSMTLEQFWSIYSTSFQRNAYTVAVMASHEADTCKLTVEKATVLLFFKIRRHHSCKLFLEKMKVLKKSTGKSRALRTKLADKNTL